MRLTVLALAAVLFAAPAAADTANTPSLPDGAKPAPASIGDLAWLAGRWTGRGLGADAEVVYSPPRNGVILGHFIAMKSDGGLAFYEFVEIESRDGSLRMRIKHFRPDFVGWEDKDMSVDFPLVAVEGNRFYFDGATTERVDENTLREYVALSHDGKVEEAMFEYHCAADGGN